MADQGLDVGEVVHWLGCQYLAGGLCLNCV